MSQVVTYEVIDQVALITIDHAENKNALSRGVVDQLSAAWERFEAGPERAAVLTAAGDFAFSVGLDLKAPPDDMWRCVPGVGVDVSKPIVCAVTGWVVGGSFVILQMADMCVASDKAKFIYPEAKIGTTGGLIAGVAGRIPHKIAMEFILLGETFTAERAAEVGMINRVVPDGTQVEEALAIAHKLAGMAPLVVSTLKGFIDDLLPKGPMETVLAGRRRIERVAKSADVTEGIAAFKEKRDPKFIGS
jgi:enoyl-CoA hydratase